MLTKVLNINKHKDRNKEEKLHEEYQYINLLKDILDEGFLQNGRNGKTLCCIGSAMHFSLENGKIPILTTKKTAWKTCLKELLWFIAGDTDNKNLQSKKVHIWDGNSSREYLDSVGLTRLEEGDIGPGYGFQWRHFNGHYTTCNDKYTGIGIDQLQSAIDILKDPTRRNSRRIIVSAWNPCQLSQMALPPCHLIFHFIVKNENRLSCIMYQRSVDTMLGLPFNIASYSFLTHLIAKHCGLEAYEFIHYSGNSHIYESHIEQVQTQIMRRPYEFPTLDILDTKENINDYTIDDFRINNYNSHPRIKAKMIV